MYNIIETLKSRGLISDVIGASEFIDHPDIASTFQDKELEVLYVIDLDEFALKINDLAILVALKYFIKNGNQIYILIDNLSCMNITTRAQLPSQVREVIDILGLENTSLIFLTQYFNSYGKGLDPLKIMLSNAINLSKHMNTDLNNELFEATLESFVIQKRFVLSECYQLIPERYVEKYTAIYNSIIESKNNRDIYRGRVKAVEVFKSTIPWAGLLVPEVVGKNKYINTDICNILFVGDLIDFIFKLPDDKSILENYFAFTTTYSAKMIEEILNLDNYCTIKDQLLYGVCKLLYGDRYAANIVEAYLHVRQLCLNSDYHLKFIPESHPLDCSSLFLNYAMIFDDYKNGFFDFSDVKLNGESLENKVGNTIVQNGDLLEIGPVKYCVEYIGVSNE